MLNIMAFVPCVTGMALPTFASEKKRDICFAER